MFIRIFLLAALVSESAFSVGLLRAGDAEGRFANLRRFGRSFETAPEVQEATGKLFLSRGNLDEARNCFLYSTSLWWKNYKGEPVSTAEHERRLSLVGQTLTPTFLTKCMNEKYNAPRTQNLMVSVTETVMMLGWDNQPSCVFKPSELPGWKRTLERTTFRNPYAEFATYSVAKALKLDHLIAPLTLVKGKIKTKEVILGSLERYISYMRPQQLSLLEKHFESPSVLQKCDPVVQHEAKFLVKAKKKFEDEKRSLVNNNYNFGFHNFGFNNYGFNNYGFNNFDCDVSPEISEEVQKMGNGWRLYDDRVTVFTDILPRSDLIPAEYTDGAYILIYLVEMLDPHTGNFMLDGSQGKFSLRLIDTEYSLGHGAEYIGLSPSALLLMPQGQSNHWTEKGGQLIRNLNATALAKVVRQAYPKISTDNLNAFVGRVNALKQKTFPN